MPTDVFTYPAADTTMRYRQAYTTEGLNQKNFALMPHGIYRGFQLGVDGGAGDRTVNVEADPNTLDGIAVVNTAAGFSLTVRHAGDVLLDLSAYASITVVVAVFGSYAVGATTAALIRVFTLAEFVALAAATRGELVVLGTVDVPAAATAITATEIFDDRRSQPFMSATPGHAAWTNILPNGYFAAADVGVAVADTAHEAAASGWSMISSDAALAVSVEASSPAKGENSLELALNTAGTPSGAINVISSTFTHVTPGKRFRIKFQYDILATLSAGTATFEVSVIFYDVAGTPTLVKPLALSSFVAPTGGYVQVDQFVVVPAGSVWGGALLISLTQTAATWDVSPSIRMDDFQLFVEPKDPGDAAESIINVTSPQRVVRQEWFRALDGDEGEKRIITLADTAGWPAGGVTNVVRFLRALADGGSASQAVLQAEGIMLGRDVPQEVRDSANDKYPLIMLDAHASLGTDYKLLAQCALGGSPTRGRLYMNSSGQMVFTSNCFWDSATSMWDTDAGVGAIKMTFGQAGVAGEAAGDTEIKIQYHNAFGEPWADVDTLALGDWDYQLFFESSDAGPTIRQRGRSLLGFTFNGPGQVADIHTCKAWAVIDKQSLASPTIITGNGIASVSTIGNALVCTLSNAMRDSFYYVGITEDSDLNGNNGIYNFWDKGNQSTTAFRIDARDTFVSGSIQGWSSVSTTVLRIMVMVIGQQV